MATVKLFLDELRPTKGGRFAIRLQIGHKSSKTTIKTPYAIPKDYWENGQIKKRCPGIANVARANADINKRLSKATEVIEQLNGTALIRRLSLTDLKRRIEVACSDSDLVVSDSFLDYMEAFEVRKRATNKRTAEIYGITRRKILAFQKGAPLMFADLSVSWLNRFDLWMINRGNSANTRSIEFRNIRAVFNAAIDDDELPGVTLGDYPFRKFKVMHEKTAKRNFSIEFLHALYHKKGLKNTEARDLFFLIFFLIGINLIDLFYLEAVHDGRIEYRRRKGGKHYSIKLEPEAMALLKKYKGKNRLLFYGDRMKVYNSFKKYATSAMRELASELNVPKLTTYYARHSWASIARNIGVSKDDIRSALGHGDNTVTDIYIDLDRELIDKANRQVIDAVINYKPKKKPANS
ncbi:tyrosine-type recombinase/integrase [Sunxiuqinia indica]|uniref:tyrosine-type recombinase/integrase n=1 Tax=Sunxiuqinia indica TaxID=2692584 RepID=UPI00135771D4|nr:site-specific integrase [Sunxiuqinia indica]